MQELKDHIEALKKNLGPEVSDQEVEALKCTLRSVFKSKGIELPEKILLATKIAFEQHQSNVNLVIYEDAEDGLEFIVEVSNSDGTILFIDQCSYEDNRSHPNHLKDYPLLVEGIEFTLVKGHLYASGEEVTIKYPTDNVNTFFEPKHTPLTICNKQDQSDQEDDQQDRQDQLIYLGHTELPDLSLDGTPIPPDSLKFILCRHAWGFNITIAYYVRSCNTLFCGTTYNQDYPEPTAIEISGNELIMYLHTDEPKLKRVYQSKQPFEPNANLTQIYGHAPTKRTYNLKNMESKMSIHYSVKPLTLGQQNQLDELESCLYDTPITDDKWLKNIVAQYAICPFSANVLYNMACAHAVRDRHDAALHYLEESMKRDRITYSHMFKDADLKSLRSNPKFIQLMENYKSNRV